MRDRDGLVGVVTAATALELACLTATADGPGVADLVGAASLLVAVWATTRVDAAWGVAARSARLAVVGSVFVAGSLGTTLVELQRAPLFAVVPVGLGLWAALRLGRGVSAWGVGAQIGLMGFAIGLDGALRAGSRPLDLPWGAAIALVGAAAVLVASPIRGASVVSLGAVLWPRGEPPAWTATGAVPEGPDVVLISVDTLRADVADGMAAVGWIRERGWAGHAQAAAPWTLPGMASVMTGREVAHHGAWKRPDGAYTAIDPGVTTLAERFGAAGWDTAASVENPFVGPWFGFGRGVAVLRHDDAEPWALPGPPFASVGASTGHLLMAALGLMDGPPVGADRRLAQASAMLAGRRDRPLWLWVHLLDVHRPYRHAASLDRPLPDQLALLLDTWPTDVWKDHAQAVRAGYDHEVAHLDRVLLAWLEGLPDAGPRGRVIALVADHGEAFGEHGGWEHGHAMYQELLDVPLAVTGEGVPRRPVGQIDLAPTLLRRAGLSTDGLDGAPIGEGDTPPIHRSMSTLYGDPTRRAARRGETKVVARAGAPSEVYDLGRDPGELRAQVVPALDAWLPPEVPAVGEETELSPAVEEQLRQLGYVE